MGVSDATALGGQLIYHITTRQAWASDEGDYSGDTVASEGFIHCATADQVDRVAETRFAGRPGLVLLSIDPGRVRPEIRYEGGGFPHIYGPLNCDAVVSVDDFAVSLSPVSRRRSEREGKAAIRSRSRSSRATLYPQPGKLFSPARMATLRRFSKGGIGQDQLSL